MNINTDNNEGNYKQGTARGLMSAVYIEEQNITFLQFESTKPGGSRHRVVEGIRPLRQRPLVAVKQSNSYIPTTGSQFH
jgi:hypothetical protein